MAVVTLVKFDSNSVVLEELGREVDWDKFGDNAKRDVDFHDEFRAFIASKLGVKDIVSAIKLSSKGTQNTHFKLEDDKGKNYIFRMGNDGFISDWEAMIDKEFAKLKFLSELNCGIYDYKMHFLDTSRKFVPWMYFVGEFIEGETVDIGKKCSDELVVQIANHLKSIHSLKSDKLDDARDFDYAASYAPVHEVVHERVRDYLSDLMEKIDETITGVSELVKKSPKGLVHGDAYRGNILKTADGIQFVDWEISHNGYQLLDFAIFYNDTQLTENQRELFWDTYGLERTLENRLVVWFMGIKRDLVCLYFLRQNENLKQYAKIYEEMLSKRLDSRPH